MSKILNAIRSFFNGDSKLQIALEIVSIVSFGLVMLSIPACSFTEGLTFVTWILTGVFIVSISALLIIYYKIKIDVVNLSLVLFCICALISTLINLSFKSFVITPIVLTIFTGITYTYCVSNKKTIKPLLLSSFIGVIVFLILYILKYNNELIHLDFVRLGADFGDINDIAIFLAFGLIMTILCFFNFKNIVIKIFMAPLFILFLYCGVSTGSKIFILSTLAVIITAIFLFFGKKKWWISLIIVLCLAGAVILFFLLPFTSALKDRLLLFFKTLFQSETKPYEPVDGSTIFRFDMFLDGITMFLRKPLFGYGIQGFFRASSYGFIWSHNNISESLCSFGIIGTIFFHFGLIYAFVRFVKMNDKTLLDKSIFLIILLLIITMISVALNSQKIYAYIIGICIAYFVSPRTLWTIGLTKKEKADK